jgi:hypothetical protein
MKQELKYMELKSGYNDNGPAWIGYVEFSKSGKTIYFNDHAFSGNGHGGSHDIETGEIYWITGIKKNGNSRHIYGRGRIQIEDRAIEEYEAITAIKIQNNKNFEIVTVKPTNKERFSNILNEKL